MLKDRDMKDVIAAAYRKSKDQVGLPKEQMVNYVKDIYAPFIDRGNLRQDGGTADTCRNKGEGGNRIPPVGGGCMRLVPIIGETGNFAVLSYAGWGEDAE